MFLKDITKAQHRAGIEKAFFHDIGNMLNVMVGASELLSKETTKSDLVQIIKHALSRLTKEVEIQRSLTQQESYTYQPLYYKFTTLQIQEELKTFYLNHSAARNKNIQFLDPIPHVSINTDMSLLLRILGNMIINALEDEFTIEINEDDIAKLKTVSDVVEGLKKYI